MDLDIQNLQEILKLRGNSKLARLLNKSKSNINESNQYGSYAYSFISTFEIISPVKETIALRDLSDANQKEIFEATLELYPHRSEEPEIVDIEYLIESKQNLKEKLIDSDNPPEYKEESSDTNPIPIQAFISYSTIDKKLAGAIAKSLQSLGINIFLAHESIKPSLEWQEEILFNLQKSEIFIPLLTENFKKSDWTDQESGIAFINKLKVIPIYIHHQPYGFLSKYQSIKLSPPINRNDVRGLCLKISKIITEDERLAKRLIQNIITQLIQSYSFNRTRLLLKQLPEPKNLSADEAQKIIQASVTNNQIFDLHKYDSFTKPALQKIINLHKKNIDKDTLEKFDSIYNQE